MNEPLTPEQEARVRQIVQEEILAIVPTLGQAILDKVAAALKPSRKPR